jgi:hypothetical protein
MSGFLIAFGAGILLVGVPTGVRWWLRTLRIRARAEAEAVARGRIARVDECAVFRGTSGRGSAPFGSGCLVLTDQELVFVQWVPHRVLRIDRAAVVRVDRVHTHLGQASLAPLLAVTWRGEGGEERNSGWRVQHCEEWTRQL